MKDLKDAVCDLLLWIDIYTIFMNGEPSPSYTPECLDEIKQNERRKACIFEQVENAAEKVETLF